MVVEDVETNKWLLKKPFNIELYEQNSTIEAPVNVPRGSESAGIQDDEIPDIEAPCQLPPPPFLFVSSPRSSWCRPLRPRIVGVRALLPCRQPGFYLGRIRPIDHFFLPNISQQNLSKHRVFHVVKLFPSPVLEGDQ